MSTAKTSKKPTGKKSGTRKTAASKPAAAKAEPTTSETQATDTQPPEQGSQQLDLAPAPELQAPDASEPGAPGAPNHHHPINSHTLTVDQLPPHTMGAEHMEPGAVQLMPSHELPQPFTTVGVHLTEEAEAMGLSLPEADANSGGFELCAAHPVAVASGERQRVRTGVHLELPPGVAALICGRLGDADRNGLQVLNAPAPIGPGYRGELDVVLQNTGETWFRCGAGAPIALLLLVAMVPGAQLVQVTSTGD